jgi:hypothetical protein
MTDHIYVGPIDDDLGKAKCAVCGERPEEHVDGDDAGIAEEADLLLGPGYR